MTLFGWGYTPWLVVVSAFWLVAERLRPARPHQRPLRRQLANDAFYLWFNGVGWGVVMGALGLVSWIAPKVRAAAGPLLPVEGWLDGRSFVVQVLVFLVVSDFVQWCIHNLLHRVPFLWQFHKVHHSIHEMDWVGNFRFHWMEHVVYRSLGYLPVVVLLGGDWPPLLFAYVFGTFWGHFNHANVDVDIGPLGYVFNSPRMHLWHHDASDEGGRAKNFGIVLSCWDWLFGTAYWPRDRSPSRIGYPEDAEMPRDVVRQALFPLTRRVE